MNFFYFDIIFLICFVVLISIFLYKNRKKLDVESKVILLYRTKWGINLINKLSKKYSKQLRMLQPFIIFISFLLMGLSLYMIILSLIMMFNSLILPRIPPLMPLIPYLPRIFKVSFLPPLYFTYWLLILIVTATVHEFAHGVIAAVNKIKIKSTGFGFLGPFILAFVEPDEKRMEKKSIKSQMAILGAGSFANLSLVIIAVLLLQLFYFSFYSYQGVGGYFYSVTKIPVNESFLVSFNGTEYNKSFFLNNFESILNLSSLNLSSNTGNTSSIIKILYNGTTYFMTKDLFAQLHYINKTRYIIVFEDTPAFRSNLSGAIISVNGIKIRNLNQLLNVISSLKPNTTAIIQTTTGNYSVTISERNHKPFLGIAFPKFSLFQRMWVCLISPYFSPYAYVSPKFNQSLLDFFKYFLFWLILINLTVAIINMLPFAIFDGGRMFSLFSLWLLKDKHKANNLVNLFNSIILFLLFLMMVVWLMKI